MEEFIAWRILLGESVFLGPQFISTQKIIMNAPVLHEPEEAVPGRLARSAPTDGKTTSPGWLAH